jgi:class 3 adenylate cyclase
LFTDIVGSTRQARRLGRRWRELLTVHDELARRLIDQAGGRLVNTTGDGILATFDGPGRGIHCAIALRDQLRGIDVQVRAGLHVGEVELRDGDVGGMAVLIAARVMAAAQPDEILVSRTIRDLSLAPTPSWTTAERGRSRASRATGSCSRCTGPATLPTAERSVDSSPSR